ncbi:MAG: hypothetical protein QOF76_3602, partial [Solirubrobacteraceae bacterium]|nr:hypothetical protein [Solirubrobacteraceae bacterium]
MRRVIATLLVLGGLTAPASAPAYDAANLRTTLARE